MKTWKIIVFVIPTLYLSINSVSAATEYLRFEGSIGHLYDHHIDDYYAAAGYEESLGFTSSQLIYFDFQIDTNLDATGNLDSMYKDNFAVTYLTGSIAGLDITYGATSSFPEGYISELFITSSLSVGQSWKSLDYPSEDESISTWNVGT